jgi:hypothetical protein
MFKRNKIPTRGFMAIFPALIISSILIILCTGISRSFLAFLYRTTIFDEKVQSTIFAHSCALRVLARQVQAGIFAKGDNIVIGDTPCVVESFSATNSSVSVKINEAVGIESVSY